VQNVGDEEAEMVQGGDNLTDLMSSGFGKQEKERLANAKSAVEKKEEPVPPPKKGKKGK